MPNYSKEICYFCGKPATSTEHAPPKSMFKGFVCDSITAPSCALHNNHKSGDDQVFINAFIHSLDNFKKEFNKKFHPDVEKSISLFSKDLHFSKKRLKNVNVIDDQSYDQKKIAEITYVKGKIKDWIIQISAVLVWDAIKHYEPQIEWKNSIFYSTSWIPSNKDQDLSFDKIKELDDRKKYLKTLEANVNWKSGWASSPKPYPKHLYRFYLFFETDSNEVIFKHRFYDDFEFLVISKIPKDVIQTLILK